MAADVPSLIRWITGDEAGADLASARPLVVDGVEFQVAPFGGAPGDRQLVVVKPRGAIEGYQELLGRHDHPNVVELGIAFGGSVGLFALLAQPSKLVAVELSAERVPLLDDLIASRGLEDRVRLHYGTDQADVARLAAIVDEEFRGESLDLVIDDASHMYDETVASFELLFPHLRPGGDYVIEDWSADHWLRAVLVAALADPASPQHGWAQEAMAGRIPSGNAGQAAQTAVAVASLASQPARPLSRLAAQLVLAAAEPGSGVESVVCNRFWFVVRRSDDPLEPGAFRLADACPDPFGTISA
jgi:hypothetical protein